MHQFKIIYIEYNEKGALTNIKHHVYADTVEQAQVKFEELSSKYITVVVDAETGEAKKYKAYKVSLLVAAYKGIDNPTEFFKQFEI